MNAPTSLSRPAALVAVILLAGVVPTTSAAQPSQPSQPTTETDSAPTDDKPPEPDSDAALERRLEDVYAEIASLEGVEVSVAQGVVKLSGRVPTPTARDTAGDVAGRFEHTLYVDNRLDVEARPAEPEEEVGEQTVQDEQIQTRLASIFSQVEELREVDVEVQAGLVRLTGETASPEAHRRAEDLAQKLDGVLYVDNDIELLHGVGERFSLALERAGEKLEEVVGFLPLFAVALVILGLFWLLARLVSRVDLPGQRIAEKPFLQNILRQIVSFVVFLVGVLFVLELFEVTTLVGALLGGAGLAGLAIGFAFRDIAENYLASLVLGVQQPFSKNDHIRVDEYEGKVVRLTTRETVLMTLEGNHVRLPNSMVFKNPTYNFTRNPRRRFSFEAGISVDEDLTEVQRIGVEALRDMKGVADDPEPYALVGRLGDSNVVVEYYGWIDQSEYDWQRVQSEAVRRVKSALDAEGIEMPEPIHRVLTRDLAAAEKEETDRQERAARELREPGPEVEVSPEIDEQIEEDRERSEETDLLSD